MEQSFIAYIEESIRRNWDLDALTAQQFALGRSLPGRADLRGGGRAHPARVQGGQRA